VKGKDRTQKETALWMREGRGFSVKLGEKSAVSEKLGGGGKRDQRGNSGLRKVQKKAGRGCRGGK